MTELQKDVEKIMGAISDLYLEYNDEELVEPLRAIRDKVRITRKYIKRAIRAGTPIEGSASRRAHRLSLGGNR